MKKICYILLSLLLFAGCKPTYNKDEVPSYIRVDKVHVNTDYANYGDSSQNISDIWVSVNGQFIGGFELPATIPVLNDGDQFATFQAGVKEDGIASTRAIYPFYNLIPVNIKLQRGKTLLYRPSFTYNKNAKIIHEGFDGLQSTWQLKAFTGDNSIVSRSNKAEPLSGNNSCLLAQLTTSANSFVYAGPSVGFTLGKQVWAEISFNSEVILNVGLFVSTPSTTGSHSRDILELNTTNGVWKKVYVNFTSVVQEETPGSKFTFYITASKADGTQIDNIYLDNIKILYFE